MRSIFAALLCFLICASGAWASEIQEIDPQELKSRLDAGEELILVNTLPPLLHQVKHLPGSINIPVSLIEEQLPAQVADLDAPLVFYCMGKK